MRISSYSLFVSLILFIKLVQGESFYYVSISAGSDLNVGSLLSPFSSITKCVNVAQSGDTCYIREGTYREIIPSHNGINLSAYNNESVIISISDVINTPWKQHSGDIWTTSYALSGGAGLKISDNELRIDGKIMSPYNISEDYAVSSMQGHPGQWFYDQVTQSIYLWLPYGADPNAHTVEVFSTLTIAPLDKVELDNNMFGHRTRRALNESNIKPTNIYLSYTDEITNMRVTYTTYQRVTTQSYVYWWYYGLNGAVVGLHSVAVGNSDTRVFVRPLAVGITEYITTVTMGINYTLTPKNKYTYQIRLDASDSNTWSSIYDFVSLPNANQPITLCIFGDVGAYGPIITSNAANGLKAFAVDHKMDLIIHNGDIAYDLDEKNGTIGQKFMENIQEISARVPYTVTAGNHEYYGNSKEYYTSYFSGQDILGIRSNSTQPLFWFSFDVSFGHFVVIDTEYMCQPTARDLFPTQWAWLENDLSLYRSSNPDNWIFIFGHRQMYLGSIGTYDSYFQRYGFNCSNPNDWSSCSNSSCLFHDPERCGFAIEPLLFKYKVDFSFEGHQHVYQRFFPIGPNQTYETQDINLYVNPKYPIHVVSGAGGSQDSLPAVKRERKEKRENNHVAKTVGNQDNEEYIVDIPSFTIAKIYNSTHIEFSQITPNQTEPVDAWWVVKDSSRPTWNTTSTFNIIYTNSTICE